MKFPDFIRTNKWAVVGRLVFPRAAILLFVPFVSLQGCSSPAPKATDTIGKEDGVMPEFNRGMHALEAEDFTTASDVFDRLLVAKPASEMDLVIGYNSGVSHEGLGDCQKASERYREVVRSSAGKFARVEAQAAYRLSLMYECLGQDAKTITALLDARKRAGELPLEQHRAEIPARLAAAYARMGNRSKALEYFNQATTGLKTVLAKGGSTHAHKETMARTLYYMGRLNTAQRAATVEPSGFLQSLSMQQPFLLQAVELGHPHWSRKAAEDLETAYDNIMRFRIQNRVQRFRYYTRALQVIAELQKIRLPDAGPDEDQIFEQVDKTHRQIQVAMADVGITTPLTPEAEKREGLKRQGRLVDPRQRAPSAKNKSSKK